MQKIISEYTIVLNTDSDSTIMPTDTDSLKFALLEISFNTSYESSTMEDFYDE